ncbi:MAG: hypothetical protein HQK52_18105 [Oligoflexia bacterium]|nr:hypothetical protein [Oligoflexia bacterium]
MPLNERLNDRQELLKKCQRLQDRFYLRVPMGEEAILFPQKIKLDFNRSDYHQLRQELIHFFQWMDTPLKRGEATIESKCIKTKRWGEQTIPLYLVFSSIGQLSRFNKREEEYLHFSQVLAMVHAYHSSFAHWPATPGDVKDIHQYSCKEWEQILVIVDTLFHANDLELKYVREVLSEGPSKFLEQNKGIIKKLLLIIRPDLEIRLVEESFEEVFCLKSYPVLIRMRFLDFKLKENLDVPFDDFALSKEDLSWLLLKAISKNGNVQILITENKMNYFALPKIQNTIAIFGEGLGVIRLKEVAILQQIKIYYWGDIDAKGFEILASLRSSYPQVTSLMMDKRTFEEFRPLAIATNYKGLSVLPVGLTEEEKVVYQMVKDHCLLLEQEKINKQYMLITLNKTC